MLDVMVGSSEVNVTRPESVKQAWPLLSIRTFVLGSGELGCQIVMVGPNAYPPEIPMDYSLVVHVGQPLSDAPKLQRSRHFWCKDLERERTSSTRSALASFLKNSLTLPLTIHSDTITNRFVVIVTPNSGSKFW